ncbi:MAG TPA: lantibiotic dehydratase [Vicinamibacterales bacterium]|nr:lantibiotic dehydratase [Vicinamibacterales bacterium]
MRGSAPGIGSSGQGRPWTERLRAVYGNPVLQEAILLGSAALHAALSDWAACAGEDRKTELSLYRYLARMAGRPTPFGLFAGCSFGRISPTTCLEIGDITGYRRSSSLDNGYLFTLCDRLARDPALRATLPYRPNSSLYEGAGQWRYVQARAAPGGVRHTLMIVDSDEYLSVVLNAAEPGATRSQLTDAIVNFSPEAGIEKDEASGYVDELIARQVLVGPLSPLVTGESALADLARTLRTSGGAAAVVTVLDGVREALDQADRQPLTEPAEYQKVRSALKSLGEAPEPAGLFQVDLIKPAPKLALGEKDAAQIGEAVALLHQLTPRPLDSLRTFKEAFRTRYDHREVPLVEVFDDEIGIVVEGFSSQRQLTPLVVGLPVGGAADGASSRTWSPRDEYLLKRVREVEGDAGVEVVLTPQDIESLSVPSPSPLPDALAATVTVGASGGESTFVLRCAGGPSGAGMFGRFCRAMPELEGALRRHIAHEESFRSDAEFAEIVHLPEGRLANVIARPVLRSHEISYLGRSGAHQSAQLTVTDLLVSIRDDRVILRSRRLNREVVPRLSNAHNFRRGLPIYRFLCSLQSQGVSPWLVWNWGGLETLDFLPRVRHGNVVFERARWLLGKPLLLRLFQGGQSRERTAFDEWRLSAKMPRWVLAAEGDNELPLDCASELAFETLKQLAAKRSPLKLVEMFPSPDMLCLSGPEGTFSHELIIPFVKPSPQVSTPPSRESIPYAVPSTTFVRRFAPGSSWTYIQLFAGPAGLDRLLTTQVKQFLDDPDVGRDSPWFFVRYSEPQWHLRLRIQHPEPDLGTSVLAAVDRAFRDVLASGLCSRIGLDTYEREVERYGGEKGIVLAEDFFWRDSQTAIEVLKTLPGDLGLDERWRVCLMSWNFTFEHLGFDRQKRLRLARQARLSHANLFRADVATKRWLGGRFRKERKRLETLFTAAREGALAECGGSYAALVSGSRSSSDSLARLKSASSLGQVSVSLEDLAFSLMHMQANRLLRADHRQQEFVLYDFLERLYESQIARSRSSVSLA